MQRIKILMIVIPIILIINSFQDNMEKTSVLFCYGKVKPQLVKGYKYVILESKNFSVKDIATIRTQNDKVFAYLSLGEINKNAMHYKNFAKLTMGKNEIWDSFYIDLRKDKARKILMEMVDELFLHGYDGLFLDNIDNFTIHGPQKDQAEELVELVQNIKEKYPKKFFIQNAGLDLLPNTQRYVDLVAVESVATQYDFQKKKCNLSDEKAFESKLTRINTLNATYSIPFILVEYADSNDLMKQVQRRLQDSGYDIFIGSIDLQSIPKFN